MSEKTILQKLGVLADAAKYDASCASSGTIKRDSTGTKGIGSTGGMGICHSYAPDGRCISLLKILLTNFCIYDCRFCINRASSNVPRARFNPQEVVRLTLDFYKRNYIEGLFLSSGIIRSEDYTMEQLVEVARLLREEHRFGGYIHLKTIAGASPELIARAGLYADRLSTNVELPTEAGLKSFAPEKTSATIRKTMAGVRVGLDDAAEALRGRLLKKAKAPRFAPAGQSTQMIVGADGSRDDDILQSATSLYSGYKLRRVYYSAYSPIPDASSDLPPVRPPLIREHRLYQADWLLRFYGFSRAEIMEGADDGMLDLTIDPKLAWALQRRESFPVDINRAPREMLLRVPGLGTKAVERILMARRLGAVRLGDLAKLTASVKKVLPFITTPDWRPGGLTDSANLRARFAPRPEQMSLAL
ncbi:putative DNA modification/repair radical SAM protein [Blastomonas aquatica]|uniref:DNA modification/repair radical SAM protein n=1 Tax=Blastomonas aquatica TaxID=1510276 RepID=A0ABQ1JCN2_9SPHN|nr:putative DNA modification/repair radical SAM protein [Blastomonas aquatica]GGB63693.1 putative DNA modification/repair radical SAM protein [Blastomonas aquatica]